MPTELQVNFNGGMMSRQSPERLPDNAYSFGKNIEVRDGTPRTRRGSLRLYDDIAGEAFQGSGLFRSPFRFDKVEALLVAQGGKVYRMAPPLDRVEMVLPGLLSEGQVRFVQGIDKMYLFQGEGQQVWEWNGEEDSPWSVVPEPTDGGKNLVGTERVTYAYGRFWMATERDTVEFSDLLSTSVPLSQGFNVNHGEGETVNAIFQIGNGQLILAKDRSMYVIKGANYFTDATQLSADDALSRDIGVFAQDTIIQPGSDTWYLSRDGVYSLRVNDQKHTHLVDVPISDLISDRFARINWERAHLAQGIWFDNYYLLAVPVSGGQNNTMIFAYDFLIKAWVSEWELYTGDADEVPTTLFAVSSFIVSTRLGVNRLYAINEFGGVMELLKDDLKDNYSSPDRYLDFSATKDAEDNPIEAETTIQRVNAVANLYDGFVSGDLTFEYNLGTTPTPVSANGLYRLRNASASNNLIVEIETDVARTIISSPVSHAVDTIQLEIDVGGSNVLTIENDEDTIYTAEPALTGDDPQYFGVADPASGVKAQAILDSPDTPFTHSVQLEIEVGGSNVLTVRNEGGEDYTAEPALTGDDPQNLFTRVNQVYASATIHSPVSPSAHTKELEIEVGGSNVLTVQNHTGLPYTDTPTLTGDALQYLATCDEASSIASSSFLRFPSILVLPGSEFYEGYWPWIAGLTMIIKVGGSTVLTVTISDNQEYGTWTMTPTLVGDTHEFHVYYYPTREALPHHYYVALAHLIDQLDDVSASPWHDPYIGSSWWGGLTITADVAVNETYDIEVSGTLITGGHFRTPVEVAGFASLASPTQYFTALAHLLDQLDDVSAVADGGTSVTITADVAVASTYDIVVPASSTAVDGGHFQISEVAGATGVVCTTTQYFTALAYLLNQLDDVSAVADGDTSVTITADVQATLTYDMVLGGNSIGANPNHLRWTAVAGYIGEPVPATLYFAALAYLLDQLDDVSAVADGGTSVTITADKAADSAYDIIVSGTGISGVHFITTAYTGIGNIFATMTIGGETSWRILSADRNYRDAFWHTLSIYHDGTTPVLLIDGGVPPQGLTGSTPETIKHWLDSFDGAATTEEFNIHRGRDNGFKGELRRFEVYGPDWKDEFLSDGVTANTKRVCFEFGRTPPSSFPPGYTYNLYDASDTTQRFQLGGIDLSYGNAFLGGVAPAPANIETTFISRGYGADNIVLDGSTPLVEYTVAHANPKITSSLIGSKPFSTQTMIADQTYDKTKYEVDNKSDWDATNADADHDTFGREDYPPIELGSGDSFALAEDEEITMGIEARHTHTVTGNIHSPWVRLKIENAQGRFDLIDVILNTDEQPIFTGRGL